MLLLFSLFDELDFKCWQFPFLILDESVIVIFLSFQNIFGSEEVADI